VKLWLLDQFPRKSLIQIPYQVGALLFPREAPPTMSRHLREGTFPLLAPDSAEKLPAGAGPAAAVRRAVEQTLRREKLTLPGLRIPDSRLFFKHEERSLSVVPGKLLCGPAERDELFPGKLKVRLTFTLPSGAYATLVVRRLFWFSEARDQPGDQASEQAGDQQRPAGSAERKAPVTATTSEPRPDDAPARKAPGFLARQRARKAARQAAQARGPARAKGARKKARR
jgi:tRNA pseudouridine13 synthase